MIVLHPDGVWREVTPEPQPELPEFCLSPKGKREPVAKATVTRPAFQGIRIIARGPSLPVGIRKVRSDPPKTPVIVKNDETGKDEVLGYAYELGKADPVWDVELGFKITKADRPEGFQVPMGYVEAWHKVAFNNRHTELSWLIETQRQELAPAMLTLAYNGGSGFSLSSSLDDDDELEACNIAEHRTGKVALKWDPETLAPILNTIRWERYQLGCGQPNRIYIKTDGGKLRPACTDRRWTPGQLADYIRPLSKLINGRTAQDIDDARDRAAHYRQLVWSMLTPAQQDAWMRRTESVANYLDPWTPINEDERDTRRTRNGGPQELGYHQLLSDSHFNGAMHDFQVPGNVALFEPHRDSYWDDEDGFSPFSAPWAWGE